MLKKILIVEDDKAIREMYAFKFGKEPFEVRTAEDGEKGYVIAETFLPDIILLDLRLPGMSGDEMLKKLRENDWGQNMKVIILTNISKREAPMSLTLLSVSRYIVKAHTTPAQVLETAQIVLAE